MTTVLDPAPAPPTPTSPGVRTLWKVLASLGAVALLFWGVTTMLGLLAHEQRTFVQTFDAEGVVTVDVDLDSGSVEIVAADVDEITVETEVSDGLLRTGHEQRVDGGTLVLRGSCRLFLSTFCAVHYDVQVPRDMTVVARTDNGRIRVDGITGTVSADSDNGSVELHDVHGDVHLSSDNGSLRAEGLVADNVTADSDNGGVDLGFLEPPTFVDAESDNGSVEIRLPDVVGGYRVDMDTDNGSTDLGVATDPASSRLINAHSDNGSVRVLSTEGAG